eukprot:GGOE01021209.1.p1 GENE.GGOE01021209.1~~GGOE01021209.1.p1  ORF type:complete len:125 (-),score=1.29 GGOE01021209.1:195-569(-)
MQGELSASTLWACGGHHKQITRHTSNEYTHIHHHKQKGGTDGRQNTEGDRPQRPQAFAALCTAGGGSSYLIAIAGWNWVWGVDMLQKWVTNTTADCSPREWVKATLRGPATPGGGQSGGMGSRV